jgi:hypothetical protein
VSAEKECAEEKKEAAPAAGPVSVEKEGAEEKKEAAPAAGPVSAEKEGAEEEAAEEEAVEEAAEETVDAKICFGCERAPRLAGKLFCTACRKDVETARVTLNKQLVNGDI